MITKNSLKTLSVIIVAISTIGIVSGEAIAHNRYWGSGRHEAVYYSGHRYNYYEGRFYSPSFFGFSFIAAPIGVVVTYLPYGYRTIYMGNAAYYEYDNVYYQACPTGYVVVQQAVPTYVTPNVVYVPAPAAVMPAQTAPTDSETVTISVPRDVGGYLAVTLVRYPNGFVGPQGEFYQSLPTGEVLRARYGR